MGYLALAVVLAALLLPTALRPPQDQQSTSAAFSPDAPPDDAPPEVLLQSLRQARSSTAGSVETTTDAVEVQRQQQEEEEPPPPPPPPPRKRAARNPCFGDPPRQTESLYSALCVPAFTDGDNGGKTAPGVYPDEIRIGITVASSSSTPEGKLPREFSEADTEQVRMLKVWQTYFNDRFEFFKRYLQFYIYRQSSTSADQQRASVETAKSQDMFAMIGNNPDAVNHAIKNQIIDFGSGNNPVEFYNDAFPYAYSFTMDSWQTRYMAAELICKQYAGKNPGELNERMDTTSGINYDEPRTWGLVSYQDTTRTGATKMIEDLLKRCGVKLTLTQEYNLGTGASGIGGVMAKFKANNISTVILNVDGLTPGTLTQEAANIEYFPEYVHTGTGEMDSNGSGRLMEDRAARHIVGLSPNEIARGYEDKDYYRAYKEVDPDGSPGGTATARASAASYFRSLQQMSGAIQHAGPKLTPLTFWEGLRKQPYRSPNPTWAIGGGYRDALPFAPGFKDLTYEDYLSMIWFDQEGDDPDSDLTGAWCHMYGGKRYQVGELPSEPIPFRVKDGCIHSAPPGAQG